MKKGHLHDDLFSLTECLLNPVKAVLYALKYRHSYYFITSPSSGNVRMDGS